MSVVNSGNYDGLGNLKVSTTSQDGPTVDAFGRTRVSEVQTLFDSKQIYDKQPLFWDDQEVSGSGTSSTHSVNHARTRLSVSNLTAGKRVRQTFQKFNYQPGKGIKILLTAVLEQDSLASGIKASVGYFDDNNGLFFTADDGVLKVVQRSYVTGSAVDTEVIQSQFNVDKMDGTGISGITIDPTKTQILIIDFEWLGVGRVRMGFVVDGKIYYCHYFNNANSLSTVYMSTPNLPVRYEIENDGTGPAASMDHICSTVIAEGGQENTGILRHRDSGQIGSLSSGTKYAALGIRLKSTALSASVLIETLSAIVTTANQQFHWELIFNPTVAGTFTYSDETNSVVQTASGSVSNTVTGGTEIDGGFVTTSIPASAVIPNALRLGSTISGTPDTIVLCVVPITNNVTVDVSLTWRELS